MVLLLKWCEGRGPSWVGEGLAREALQGISPIITMDILRERMSLN